MKMTKKKTDDGLMLPAKACACSILVWTEMIRYAKFQTKQATFYSSHLEFVARKSSLVH